MRQQIIYIAVALLVVQIGLVIAFNSGEQRLNATTPDVKFAEFNPGKISEIKISDSENVLTIAKTEEGWIIPSAYGVRADENQVSSLLDKLAEANKGFAVATSKDAAERFKTSEDNFERHLEILAGETVMVDFYLGNFADVRHTYARIAESREVYTLPISSFEVEPDADSWLDKSAVKRDKDNLTKIQIGELTLEKSREDWQLAGEDSTQLSTEAINDLIDHAANLTVQSVLDPDRAGQLFSEDIDLQLKLTGLDDESVDYKFVKSEDHYVLKTSDSEHFYKINDWQVEKLKEFTLDKLVKEEVTENASEDGSA
jgi:hypothetical protein